MNKLVIIGNLVKDPETQSLTKNFFHFWELGSLRDVV